MYIAAEISGCRDRERNPVMKDGSVSGVVNTYATPEHAGVHRFRSSVPTSIGRIATTLGAVAEGAAPHDAVQMTMGRRHALLVRGVKVGRRLAEDWR